MGQHDSRDSSQEIYIQMSAHKYLEKPGVYKESQIIINSPERAWVSGETSEFELDVIIK